jgi:hypothetical protein
MNKVGMKGMGWVMMKRIVFPERKNKMKRKELQ